MKNQLWVEKYRPDTVQDYVFVDQYQKDQVEGWIRNESIHIYCSVVTLAQVKQLLQKY